MLINYESLAAASEKTTSNIITWWMILLFILLFIGVCLLVWFLLGLYEKKIRTHSKEIKNTKILSPESLHKKLDEIIDNADNELKAFDKNNSQSITFTDIRIKHEKLLKEFASSDEYNAFVVNPNADATFIAYVDLFINAKSNEWNNIRKKLK